MKAIIDTNVLLRTIVADDEGQAQRAAGLFEEAEEIVVGVQALMVGVGAEGFIRCL
jgi:predicted nucleic acid-binding protein